jgi:hypothetical protein
MRRAAMVFDALRTRLPELAAAARPFVWAHVFVPHAPSEPPIPWRRVAESLGAGPYDGEVAYTDRELVRLLRTLAADDTDRGATIVLTADHGESLGRHVEITHGLFVYDATQLVPLILAGPGVTPRLDATQRPLLDVAPTLLAAYGVTPPGTMEGIPLQTSTSPGRAAYLETKHTEVARGWSPLHAVRTAEWKYIRAPRPELYDLLRDPGETTDVLGDHPDLGARLAARVDELRASERASSAAMPDEEVAEQLRALGYLATAEPGAEADTGVDPKDRIHGMAAFYGGEEAYLVGDLRAAELQFRRAVELDPDLKEAHSYLAGTYCSQGRFAPAVEHALLALALPPHLNEGPVHTTLAEAYLGLNRPADAERALRDALALRPDDARATALLARVRGGRAR